uniref:Transposase zinc-binding domain-containing protein n=1 Tax=Candidatus Kentrum sp. TC TaxID=2126339 RepID=A0A450YY39_9GAMM|nr:MAG: Transposase zinc-binding domain-containing protein [Candidatus Kentron sp. TC]
MLLMLAPSILYQITHIPRTCKSRFCPICAKVQVDKWVADMNRFPNCPYFHITFTVPP